MQTPEFSPQNPPTEEFTSIRKESETPINVKARQDHPAYVAEGVHRIPVPDDKVSWNVPYAEYGQILQEKYNHSAVVGEFEKNGSKGWADAPDARTNVDTVKSYVPNLPSNSEGEALNPGGRTGIKDGRGLLGKAGPNFAADPVVFLIDPKSNELQVILITRKDTGELALPGGMVDYGEMVTQTLKRELEEETGAKISMDDALIVYQGYVDDPRNTDKAWMETTVAAKLLEPEIAEKVSLQAGDDAKAVHAMRVDSSLFENLYASHGQFLRQSLQTVLTERGENLLSVRDQIVEALG